MAVWLAVSIKRGERNIVLPITVECEPDETFMDLLEKCGSKYLWITAIGYR